MLSLPDFPDEYFQKQDNRDDSQFYSFPRKVVHIDDYAIARVRDLFHELLPPGGVYLDLMSSWRSHLPNSLFPARVVGLGMNAEEMADNPQLDTYTVQNLNQQPKLPFEDQTYDGAFCTVSAQYLQQPIAVFREVCRVLRPNAPFIVTFSNRCFPSKAVRAWLSRTDAQHIALVTTYFEKAGQWADINSRQYISSGSDPLFAVWAKRRQA